MEILRVENRMDGKGPYCTDIINVPDGYNKLASAMRHRRWSDQPTPSDDGMDRNKITDLHLFGFRDLGEMHAWFSMQGIREILAIGCFLVKRYIVEDEHVLHGRSQVAFHIGAVVDEEILFESPLDVPDVV